MYSSSIIDSREFNFASKLLRTFFDKKGFIEAATQPRLSILAACEDPTTIASFQFGELNWPLKQTGQMDLEYELLKHKYDGVFCQTTSYRLELNPIAGRHDLIFPMFEFEAKGKMEDLISLEKELLEFAGFSKEKLKSDALEFLSLSEDYAEADYLKLAEYFKVKELKAADETRMGEEIASILFIKNFPEYTSPFWNMKRSQDGLTSKKIDVIMHGIETIGSAEREVDSKIMYDRFLAISDGKYSQKIFNLFGKDRVLSELTQFLELEMFPRFGGGIGMTRFIRALKNEKIMPKF